MKMNPISTQLKYLIRDPRHDTEKPYQLRYDAGESIPDTNMEEVSHRVDIQDFRPLQDSQSLEKYGFTSIRFDAGLTADDFDTDEKIEDVYYPAIVKVLKEQFPDAAEIKILETVVRKRDPRFNAIDEQVFETVQPAPIVHIDFSNHSASRTASAGFKLAPDQYRRLITVNIWKHLQGPGNDWPLALCDRRTIDRDADLITTDVVFVDRFTEIERVYHNPKHKWYYFKDLADDEAILFLQTDSNLDGHGGAAHASFNNPYADANAAPRSSVELRAYIFFM